MKDLRKWMANTAFDAAMPLGFVILASGVPMLLMAGIVFLILRGIWQVIQIGREKRKSNETEMEPIDKKAE